VFQPALASAEDMTLFHSDDYVEFLRLVTPENQHEHIRQLKRFNVAEDCPVFDGLFNFCQVYTGGSVGGAVRLNHGQSDTVVNWSGGLHHAKKAEASGFCYINDIVLCILELLKVHQRVLYIDIDIHHGDGVEEAFYTTDRVMTVSFHKFGEYFPGTGHLQDVGQHAGKYYSVNVPLKDGIDDGSYEQLYKPIMAKVMEVFRPEAIVFQSGADSLSGDRLGCFNLSIRGHAECLKYMRTFHIPMIVLGGGGYTIRNVARCWAYETGCLLGVDMDDTLPANDYSEYFGPTHQLHIQTSNMENQNTVEYLQGVRNRILEHLSQLQPAPSVPLHEAPTTHVSSKHVQSMNTERDNHDYPPAHDAELDHEHDKEHKPERNVGTSNENELPSSAVNAQARNELIQTTDMLGLPGHSRAHDTLPNSANE